MADNSSQDKLENASVTGRRLRSVILKPTVVRSIYVESNSDKKRVITNRYGMYLIDGSYNVQWVRVL